MTGTMVWQHRLPSICPAAIRFGGGMTNVFGDVIGVSRPTDDVLRFRMFQLASRLGESRYNLRWLTRRELVEEQR